MPGKKRGVPTTKTAWSGFGVLSVLETTLRCLRSIQLDKYVCLELRETDLGLSQVTSEVIGMSYLGKSGEMVAAAGTPMR